MTATEMLHARAETDRAIEALEQSKPVLPQLQVVGNVNSLAYIYESQRGAEVAILNGKALLTPPEAVALAKWILEVFADVEPAAIDNCPF